MIETKPATGIGASGIATWSLDSYGRAGQAGKVGYTTMSVTGAAATSAASPAFAAPGLTDPVAADQWHLGKLGNISAIWADYTGKGINVGVYDSGVQYSHPDLAANYDASLEVVIDGKQYDGDYVPNSGGHGTSVAGLIAAARDGIGTVGVAYDASITGVNIFDPYSGGKLDPGIFINSQDQTLFLEAMRQTSKFDVVNHSWGQTSSQYSTESSRGVEGTDAAKLVAAIAYAADTGRDGLGTVQVNAAGNNSIDAQGDSSHTDRHWISVGAYREVDGLASNYSSRGASLLISAPSDDLGLIGGTGVVTTDLVGRDGYNLVGDPGGKLDYTDQFGGTSAASPIVAGVVTLMLDANEGLGWRDVSNILAYSAKLPVAFEDATRTLEYVDGDYVGEARMNESSFVVTGPGNNQSNGGGLHYSTDYGYGAVDAYAAVRMAEAWSLFGPAQTSANEVHYASEVFEANITSGGDTSIDFQTAFNTFEGQQVGYEFTIADVDIDLEHVDMTITYTSQVDFSIYGIPELQPNDFSANRIRLTAPDGSSAFVDTLQSTSVVSGDQQSFTFGFANFRGVNATGTWKIELEATNNGVTTIHDVKLDLYGGQKNADDVYTYTDEFFTMAAVSGEGGRSTLTDADGGVDWINMAAVTGAVAVSLADGTSTTIDGKAAFTIAADSRIEHAVTGDGDDTLIGNALDNELHGMRGDDLLFGNAGNDRLYGGAGADQLFGGSGDDLLDGGTGADFLNGGAGDDRYMIDDAGDQISEFGGSGIDTVVASVSHVLGTGLENLVLTGTATIDATGNEANNYILGNAGRNVLTGGAGDDTIVTVAGNAAFKPDAGFDRVDGGSGIDTMVLGGFQGDYRVLDAGERTFLVTARGATEVSGIEQGTFSFTATQSWSSVLTSTAKFDGLSYIAGYSDLRAAYGADAAAGEQHFLEYGFAEGRALSFNSLDYLASYSDLREAFGTDAAAGAQHFIQFGAAEDRSVSFDGWAYLASYGDLIETYGANEAAAAEHFITYGAAENRAASFDAVAYAAVNPDLAAVFGTDQEALARHYIAFGYAEGRTLGTETSVPAVAALAAAPAAPAAAFVTDTAGHDDAVLSTGEAWLGAADVNNFAATVYIIA